MRFLTDTKNEIKEESVQARKRLAEERDFKAALVYFPGYLKYERSVIEYLSRFEGNYANALRKLPRSLSLMFVHSVESSIFNTELENRIREERTNPTNEDVVCNADEKMFFDLSSAHKFDGTEKGPVFIVGNILGYDTKSPTEFEISELEMLGLTIESFKAKGISELNCRGASRVMFAPYRDFLFEEPKEREARIWFSLPSGSYATVFVEELVETHNRTDG
jgi:TruD family tRNA pseudouridine synthase